MNTCIESSFEHPARPQKRVKKAAEQLPIEKQNKVTCHPDVLQKNDGAEVDRRQQLLISDDPLPALHSLQVHQSLLVILIVYLFVLLGIC